MSLLVLLLLAQFDYDATSPEWATRVRFVGESIGMSSKK